MIYRVMYEEGVQQLMKTGVPEAKLDARYLLEDACHTNQTTLLAHGDREVTREEEDLFRSNLEKRSQRIPLQQILGTTEFMGLTFHVNDKVLCPRQDTEILVEEVLRYLTDGSKILDMCTGSGCILLSLLHYSNGCHGVGVDISREALEIARKNAGFLELSDIQSENKQETVQFLESDLFEKVTGEFEIIVSNPPYIRSAEIEKLMPEVKDHEPLQALDGFEDGLFFYRKIIEQAKNYLCGGGMLFFEIGFDQADQVKQLMQEQGYKEIQVVQDFAGLDRVVLGMR